MKECSRRATGMARARLLRKAENVQKENGKWENLSNHFQVVEDDDDFLK